MSWTKYEDEKRFVGGPVIFIGLAILFAMVLSFAIGILCLSIYSFVLLMVKGYGWGLKRMQRQSQFAGLYGLIVSIWSFFCILMALPLIIEYAIKMPFINYGDYDWLNRFTAEYLEGLDVAVPDLWSFLTVLLLDGAIYFYIIGVMIFLYLAVDRKAGVSFRQSLQRISIPSEIRRIKANQQSETHFVLNIYKYLLGWINGMMMYGFAIFVGYVIASLFILYQVVDNAGAYKIWSTSTLILAVMSLIILIYPLLRGKRMRKGVRYQLAVNLLVFLAVFYISHGEGLIIDIGELKVNLRYFIDYHKKIPFFRLGIFYAIVLNSLGIAGLNYMAKVKDSKTE